MKRKVYILGVLLVLAGTFSVDSVYAQRGHVRVGGGGHFYGGARVSVGAHFGGPVYRRPPVVHYYRPAYRPYVRAYYPYYHYPLGFRLGVLPYGFITFGTAWGPYYYYDGTFYRPYDNGGSKQEYQVAEPPVGADVPSLPSGAQQVTIDGNTYYEYNGTIYQEVIKQNQRRYAIVGKNGQLNTGGDDNGQAPDSQAAPQDNNNNDNIIQALPQGSHRVEINGQELFVSPDGMYYEEVQLDNNTTGYRVVGKQTAD